MSYNYGTSYSRDYTQRSMDSTLNKDQLLEDIPDYGSAFVCGKSRFEEGKFHVRDDPIIEISCGDEHTGVVTDRGRVFMFGSNNWGQLGLGHENNVEKPSCVKAIKHEKVLLIACGRNHTILATERGNLYSFGGNSEGQLGLGEDFSESFYSTPQKITSIEPQEWSMIAAGSSHSCALSRTGDVYVWGSNENGELGLGKVSEQHYPKRVSLDFKVGFVACGYYHTALISKKGKLYTSGSNEYYQLGHSDDNRRFNEVLLEEQVSFVSCGGHHTVTIGLTGRVYTFGDGSKGQLGNGEDIQKSKRPELVASLKRKKIVQVACGECHTAFITDQDELFACGDNRYGKLGLSQKTFNSIQFNPTFVEKFKQLRVENVACGGCHMILIGKMRENNSKGDSDDSIKEKGYSERRFKDTNERSYSPRNSTKLSSTIKSYDREETQRLNRRNQSDDDDDMEKTFNRTHTLTRDNKFVPLSELNLKKLVLDERKKPTRNQNSDNDSDERYPINQRSSYANQKPNSRLGRNKDNYDNFNIKNRTRTSSNSDNENFYDNKKSFLKPIDNKRSSYNENDYNNKFDNMKITPLTRQKPNKNDSDDSDFNDTFKSKSSNYKPKPIPKLNATKSFSDDEGPKNNYLNDRTKMFQKPNSVYLRDSYKNNRENSLTPEDRPSARTYSQRRDTRNLEHSNQNLRESSKINKNTNQNKEQDKPKEKPFKICTIL